MKRLPCNRFFCVCGALLIIALTGMTQPALAVLEGPVQVLPLGTDVDDDEVLPPYHSEYGELWGRQGGRSITYTLDNASEYSQLKWNPVNVEIAFDGMIDDEDETLTYSGSANGQLFWVGVTTVEMHDGTHETIDTMFVLTVADENGSPVPFVSGSTLIFNLEGLPNALDEIIFTTTLEMKAAWPAGETPTAACRSESFSPIEGDYYPALDVFDCLETHPQIERPAITIFEYGFFYEQFAVMDLDWHDLHMENLVGSVQETVDETNMWTNYIFDEWPRVIGLSNGQMAIRDQLAIVEGGVNIVHDNLDLVLDRLDGQSNEEVIKELQKVDAHQMDYHLFTLGLGALAQDPNLQAWADAVVTNSPLYLSIAANGTAIDALSTTLNTNFSSLTSSLSTDFGGLAGGLADNLAQGQANGAAIDALSTTLNTNFSSLTSSVGTDFGGLTSGLADNLAQGQANGTAIGALSTQIATALDTLNTIVAVKDAEIAGLNAAINEKDAVIGDLEQEVTVLTTDNVAKDQTIAGLTIALLDSKEIDADVAALAHDMAQDEIDKAIAAGGLDKEIEKAERAIAKGDKDYNDGNYDKAVKEYKKAWEHAQKAIK